MNIWSNILSSFGIGTSKRLMGVQVVEPGSGKLTTRAVNADTAMQLSAAFACVRLISETIAGLPLKFQEKQAGGKLVEIEQHPLQNLLTTRPNRYQTNIEFFETLGFQLSFHGNAYHRIDRNSQGDIIALTPYMSPQVQTALTEYGDVFHRYKNERSKEETVSQDNMWHNKLFGNGIVGMSPLGYARNAIGVAISAEERVNKMANNGFKMAGILSIDKILKPDQRKKMRESYQDMYDNGDDELRVLEAGMQYTPIVANPKDVQFLESRRFQIEDIARFFNVPSVLINDTSATTVWGSGIQQIVTGWYKLGLRSYLEKIEAGIVNWLLPPKERFTIIPSFDFDMLLRGDEKSRYETYERAVKSRILTPNECRVKEGLAPIPGNDEFPILQGQSPAANKGDENE